MDVAIDRMNIGVFDNGWWEKACESVSAPGAVFPVARGADGNAYSADIPGRTAVGQEISRQPASGSVDFWLDNGGTGLNFTTGPQGPNDLHLAHELAGKILVSHIIDPLVTTFQGLPWQAVWQCLHSRTWIKAVWDRAQAAELERFGIPNVVHLPMAAANRPYNTDPLEPVTRSTPVSFVGAQNTSFFRANGGVPTEALLPGTLAQAVRTDLPDVTFHDIYHDLYALGEPAAQSDDLAARTEKANNYFAAKLFYNASLCIRNRDRFVVFLKRKIGDKFRLIGSRWDTSYGLDCEPPLPTADAYFNHFRESAINLNMVNGNAETGLNMRHFEITAAGGFMLCQRQPEIEECFKIGTECDVFDSESELLEKIHYYLAHPKERVQIALAGQQRTLLEHLYSHRLSTVVETVRRFVDKPVEDSADRTPAPT